MGTSARPEKPVGAPPGTPDDPLSFLNEPPQQGDPLDFLGPRGIPDTTVSADVTNIAPPTPPVTAVDPVAVPNPLVELRNLSERPDITAEQRAKVNRLIHASLQHLDGEEPPDPLWKQFALSAAQEMLHIPTAIARTVGLDSAADWGERAITGIEPTIDPQGGTAQALTQALGAGAGGAYGASLAFKPINALTGVALGAVARVLPAGAKAVAEVLEQVATRVQGRVGGASGEQLANAIRYAPQAATTGFTFQGLMDPESLKTPEGIGMAVLFSVLDAAGHGVVMTRVAAAEAKYAKARSFVEAAATPAEAKKVAETEMSQADKQASAQARLAARQAWDNATPEFRQQLVPGLDPAAYKERWAKITDAQKDATINKIRGIARVSILKQMEATAARTAENPPQRRLTDRFKRPPSEMKVSEIGEELSSITAKAAVTQALRERGHNIAERVGEDKILSERADALHNEIQRRRAAGDPEPDMDRAALLQREAEKHGTPVPPGTITFPETTPVPATPETPARPTPPPEPSPAAPRTPPPPEPAAGSPNPLVQKVLQGIGRDKLTPEDITRITTRVHKLAEKHKGINLDERLKTLVKAEKKALAERKPVEPTVPSKTTEVMRKIKELGLEKELTTEVNQRPGRTAAEIELAARTVLDNFYKRRSNKEIARDIEWSGQFVLENLKNVKKLFPDMDPKQQMALADGLTSGQDWATKKLAELQAAKTQPATPPTPEAGTAVSEAPAGSPVSTVTPEAPSVVAERPAAEVIGEAVAGVEQRISQAAEAQSPPAPERPAVTPPSESVPSPKVGESPAKPKEPKKYRPLARVNRDIKALEKKLAKGEVTQADYNEQLDLLVREKAALKKPKAAGTEPAPAAPAVPVVTRGELDRMAVRGLSLDQLRDQQTRIKMDMARSRGNALKTQALTHDMHLVQKEMRLKKPVNELLDDALDTHAKELESEWQNGPPAERPMLEARMKEVDAEFKKRSRPSLINAFKEERGSLYVHPDPLETNAGDLQPHSRRIQDQIEIDLEGDKPFPTLQDVFEKLHTMYSHTIRLTHPADVATERLGINLEKAPAVQNPGKFAELILGANSLGRAQRMMQFGPFRWDANGEIVESGIPGLEQIFQPLRGRINELRRFMRAQQILHAQSKGQSNINILDAVREEANVTPEIRKAAVEVTRFRRAVLDYFADAGMLSAKSRAELEQLLQAGVPLYRYMQGRGRKVSVVGAKGGDFQPPVGAKNIPQRIKQTIHDRVVDPLRVVVDMTRRMIVSADRNRLGVMLAEAAEANPEGAAGLMWRDTHIATSVDPEIIKQAKLLQEGAKADGFELPDEVAQEIAIGFSDKSLRAKTDQLQLWRNGKREVWNISPELAAMYRGYSPAELPLAIRLLGFVPQQAKTLITDNPAFGLVNMIRDTFEATLQTRYGFAFGLSSIEGFLHSVSNSKYRQEFLAGAGTAGGITGRAIESTRASLEAVLPKDAPGYLQHKIFHPLQALRQMTIPFEEAARLGEFIRARQSGAAIMDAALAAQRVTTNFQQRGLSMQGISHIVMFLNPAIQSLDTNIRALLRNPKRVAAAGVGLITLPSIYLWAANRGDKQIEEERKSKYGSGFWYFRTNSGDIGRMNKPFLFGTIFGTAIEDALDKVFDNDPTAGDRFVDALVQQLPYNWMPNMLNLTLGLRYNRDFSTGSPIAPDRLESGDGQVEPRFQARPETGPTARALGDALNVSPAKIEFVVRNAMGTLGQDALRGIDMINDAHDRYPAPVKADLPLIGRFFARYPTAGAFNIRRFYDNAKKHEVTTNTVVMLEKNDPLRVKGYIEEHMHEVALAQIYADFRKDISELRAAGEAFAVLPPSVMTPQQKRDRISAIQDQMIQMARTANELVDKLDREEAARLKAAAPRVSNLKQQPSDPLDFLSR